MIRNKLTVISLFVGVAALSSVTLLYSQGQQTKPKTDRATVVQEGVMTERQREHSKLYKGLGTGKKVRDLSREMPTGVKIKSHAPLPAGESGSYPTFSAFLEGLTCEADAVVIGVLKDKSSQITEEGDFLFTDYELNVEEVIKDNIHSHLVVPNFGITLTQAGGKIELSGHIIEAEDASFKPLTMGQRYALFLKFIPQTRAYTSLNSTSTYELSDTSVKVQTAEPTRPELNKESGSTFIQKIRAVTGECGKKPKGEKHE